MIEGEHAMDFGARQIQCGSDHGNRRLRYVPERFLQRMQDHQRRAIEVGMLRDDLGAAGGIPWFVNWRHPRSLSGVYRQQMRIGIVQEINKAVSCCDTETRSMRI